MQRTLVTLLLLLLAAPAVFAEVTLPSVFGDHMVLQRDKEVRVWGKAQPGEQVTISLAPDQAGLSNYQAGVAADKQGRWEMHFPPTKTGQSWTMTVTGSKSQKPIVFKNIVFGEVWVASGQSNMSWAVARSANSKEEIANSANDQVRMWTAARTVKAEPAFDVKGAWAVASPSTAGRFSAVAYYFARKLQEELGVPVGILHSSWGGTPIEAWTSRAQLNTIGWAKPILDKYEAAVKAFPKAKAEYDKALKRYNETRNGPANTGLNAGYAKTDFDDSQWQTMKLPQTWEKAGLNKDGVVWFRKTIDLPEGWAGQQLTLSLGPIDDGDTTYVNGTQVGKTQPSDKGNWQKPRVYKVDKKLVQEGKLTIAARVVDLVGEGGIWGKPEQLTLTRADKQGDAVSLAGDWKYHFAIELTAKNRPTSRPAVPFGPGHQHAPAGLYNGMIAPIVPYTIQGAIWYQGESNASRAEQYEKLFPGMIQDWRSRWGQGDFPFLFVQLANYRKATDKVVDTDWAHLRDAQLKTLRDVDNTGMAVTIDIGEANDIHPRNKQDVGKRLARWALVDTYGKKDVVKSGPIYLRYAVNEQAGHKSIGITLKTFGSSLRERQPENAILFSEHKDLAGFTIAGRDGKFVKAKATMVLQFEDDGTRMISVWSDQIKDPVAVRYAWEDNPTEANLVNEEGLPASPFRTDDFKGPTDGRR